MSNMIYDVMEMANEFNIHLRSVKAQQCMKRHRRMFADIIQRMTDNEVEEFCLLLLSMGEKDWMRHSLSYYDACFMTLYNKLLLEDFTLQEIN